MNSVLFADRSSDGFFISVDKFSSLFSQSKRKEILNNLVDLDGIGVTQIKSIENFFLDTKNIEVIKSLIEVLKIKNFKNLIRKGKLSNKNLMFTGGFKKISRSEAKALTEDNGGKVLGAISKKLDMIIVGNSKPTKKKVDKAKELKIQIINENDWYKLLNI